MLESVQSWWRTRSVRQRVHAVLLVLFTAGAVVHQATLLYWYIEDAAISFSFARNLIDGYGLVAVPGGERIEGYSNPTWVALMAVVQLVGLSPFESAKALQLVFAGLTVPLTYAIARQAVHDPESDAPLLAAGFLAANSQFAIWGSCGLENSLFSLLLALALWRMFAELQAGRAGREGWPMSAWLWLALALTRPEGIAYAAIGGFFSMAFSLADRRGLGPTAKWLAAFWVPFGVYHAIRFDYFAWELPQTYYAKMGDNRGSKLLVWQAAGWTYVRGWARGVGNGYLLPVYLLGLSSHRGSRALIGISLAFVWAFAALLADDDRLLLPVVLVFTYLLYLALVRTPEDQPRPALTLGGLAVVGLFIGAAEWMRAGGARSSIEMPAWMDGSQPYLGLALVVVAPLLAWGAEGARERVVSWALLCFGLLYAVSVHGDWMAGWRWMSLVAVPGSVLLGLGAESAARLAQNTLVASPERGPLAYLGAIALLLAPVPANVMYTQQFLQEGVTGPFAVRQRVTYKDKIKHTLHWYGPIIDLDVDMGAHMFWSKGHQLMDLAGLVDVPFAQHRFQRDFVHEYVFQERQPAMVHLHGQWSTTSRIPSHPEWRQQYVQIPGYPAGGDQLHVGNYLRRDLLFRDHWFDDEDRRVAFDAGVELVGWRIPSPEVAPDRRMYLEVAVRAQTKVKVPFRVIAFLVDPNGEHLVSWDLAPAYDWVDQEDWRRDEIFVGSYSPLLPADLPLGRYDLGFALIDENGRILPASSGSAVLGGVDGVPARLLAGEVRFSEALEVVSEEQMVRASKVDRQLALTDAAAGQCGRAAESWFNARSHRPRATNWFDAVAPETDRAIADCYVGLAASDPENRVAHLLRAQDWDRFSPALLAAAGPVADERMAAGALAWEALDWEAAYQAYSDAVAVDPTRSWARRWAEKARAERFAPKASGAPE